VFISTATSTDEAQRRADTAVLPVGSFEQHGSHLPLSTDRLIAAAIARRVAGDYNLLLLPPITISCSRIAARVETSNHGDMHGGEAETRILLAESPELVGDNYRDADHLSGDRRHLLTIGLRGYAENGIIGRPSLATADKGRKLLDAFSRLFKDHLTQPR
jgi:creatinine amidohydrolase